MQRQRACSHINEPDLKAISDIQYQLIAARRQGYDAMLWQTPVISLTAQAFLFTIALGSEIRFSRIIANFLAFVAALASAHLMYKHRYFEVGYSLLLEAIEKTKHLPTVHGPPPEAEGFARWSSYYIWQGVFFVFALAALVAGFR